MRTVIAFPGDWSTQMRGNVRLNYECSIDVVALQARHSHYWMLLLGTERHVGSEPIISSLIKPRDRGSIHHSWPA